MIRTTALALGLVVALGAPAFAATDANAIVGVWMTEEKDAHAEIYTEKQDDGTVKYFGKLIWLSEPLYEDDDPEAGKPRRDRNNPEEDLQNKPIKGLVFLKGFTFDKGDGYWSGGTIYDPNNGKTYKSQMKLEAKDGVPGGEVLNIRGYIGIPALGRTTVWTKVPEDERKDKETE